jgi:ring-1,2-phenylacetyl-CoA epoxidase subunit PaaA
LRTRVQAYEDGAWFRDALVAHADKQRSAEALRVA